MMNALERRSTFALSSIFALRMLGLFMIIPVFSVAGQSYQYATPALIGLAVGVYGLTQAILQIPFSLLADRFSRKPLVVLGLLLFAIGGAIAGLSDTIYGVIIGRAVAGAGAVSAVVMALLADVTREEQRTKAMAAMGMSIGLSFVVAFSLGPWLTSLVGISGLFFVTTIMGLAAILMLLLVPKVTRHHKNFQQGYLSQLKQIMINGSDDWWFCNRGWGCHGYVCENTGRYPWDCRSLDGSVNYECTSCSCNCKNHLSRDRIIGYNG